MYIYVENENKTFIITKKELFEDKGLIIGFICPANENKYLLIPIAKNKWGSIPGKGPSFHDVSIYGSREDILNSLSERNYVYQIKVAFDTWEEALKWVVS